MTRKELTKDIFGDKPMISIIKKLLEYGGIIAALWAFALPAVREEMRGEITEYHSALQQKEDAKIPFRTLLSQEMGVPSDRVHIVMGELKTAIDSAVTDMDRFAEYWIPYLEEEREHIRPRLEIINGSPWWIADDNERYRVQENGFYYKDGEWKLIFTF